MLLRLLVKALSCSSGRLLGSDLKVAKLREPRRLDFKVVMSYS